ncbi:condensation domain-containing protein [Microbispora siamensis]|uniref:Condensation domain-containing protein n=1 Tax=Microbispora siamensis TaxID=564413 RepID=A0ABQ4GZS8_9ACTN|nr:condensation domain-containing protein [Microbispora siamensis]GIH66865.1 hypothetical protein Msi02_76820 [Microbispora siamensis]
MSTLDKVRVPLSFNQEFLCLFDKGDEEGPFGPRYNIVCGWRLGGAVDVPTLRAALHDVVERHEALRTRLVRDEGDRHQEILPAEPPRVEVRDLPGVPVDERDRRAEELLIELEGGSYGLDELPLIRAVLGRFDERDSVLALIAHHSAVDEWSMKVVIQDLANRYAARRGYDVPELPPAHQYQEYALWDRERAASPAFARAKEYWRETLAGGLIIPTRTDRRRSENLPKSTAAYRFLIGPEETSAALALAKATRSSPFMVLLAAYEVYLHEVTGRTDIAVTTLAAGRTQSRFQQTVGSFFNLLPLRSDLSGCRDFRDVIARVRAACIGAYAHDIPFGQIVEQAPEAAASFEGDDTAVISFQVFQFPFSLERERIGDIEYTDMRRRVLSQPVTTDVPDGALWTLDIHPEGDIVASLWFNTNLFVEETIRDMVSRFLRVLRTVLADPDAPLAWGTSGRVRTDAEER